MTDMYTGNIYKPGKEQDEKWMRRALGLAARGFGHVSPNPAVGAVIVRDGEVIGEGWHQRFGGLHAERNALRDCRERGNDPAGATIYVTLEPCCHYGKTPPCTEAIMENHLGRVVFGAWDPNPLVAGKGAGMLREAGIETEGPVLEDECLKVNEIFFHYITTGKPFVILKYAMTADGKIASYTGDSKWVSGEESRHHVHETRHRVSGIMAGINTVLTDDPMLNCRLDGDASDPVRIICDTHLRLPADSRIVKTAREIRTIAAHCETGGDAEMAARAQVLREAGVELLEVKKDSNGHVNTADLASKLGEAGIDSILLEGGSELAFSALSSGIVSKLQIYMAPKIIGGRSAKSPVGGGGIPRMADCIGLADPQITRLGDDLLIEYTVGKETDDVHGNN